MSYSIERPGYTLGMSTGPSGVRRIDIVPTSEVIRVGIGASPQIAAEAALQEFRMALNALLIEAGAPKFPPGCSCGDRRDWDGCDECKSW